MSVVSEGGGVPLLPRDKLLWALGDPGRWMVLMLLADGLPKTLTELARAVRKPLSTVSKQLKILVEAGVLAQGQARMYRIPAHLFPEKGKPVVDLGYMLLRLDVKEPD